MVCRCGNVAAILELDEHLQKNFTIFEAAPQVTPLYTLTLVSCRNYHYTLWVRKNETPTTAHQYLTQFSASVCVRPAVIKSPFHTIGSARTAVGLFLLLV